MSEMKKYMDVVRLGHKTTVGILNVGDRIVIQEKIDGANSSFKRDGGLRAFSRNTELDEKNTLRGFWEYANSVPVEKLINGMIYFGEWLVPHKVKYPENAYKKFYLFDIYDEKNQRYMPWSFVKAEAYALGLETVPVFYEGEYISFEHLMSFVGKTQLGGEKGEGIVVKNVDYTDRFGNQLFVKLVSEEFAETMKQKAPKDPSKFNNSPEGEFVIATVTPARVDKLLHKLVDEGILEEGYGVEDMGLILKNLGSRVIEDILKEEADMLPDGYDEKLIGKHIGKELPPIVKSLINRR